MGGCSLRKGQVMYLPGHGSPLPLEVRPRVVITGSQFKLIHLKVTSGGGH